MVGNVPRTLLIAINGHNTKFIMEQKKPQSTEDPFEVIWKTSCFENNMSNYATDHV